MKRILSLTGSSAALGVWAGMRAWQSASAMANIQAGLAIVIGANLVFCLWLWHRAQPGSGDATVLPFVALLSSSMLLGILPRVFWPTAERLHIAGSIASLVVTTVLVIMQFRRWRRRRQAARPV
jgi:FtsH-binding integral membrane protein